MFESNVEAIEYTIRELSFAVLYDVAKLLRYKALIEIYKMLGKTKRAKSAIQYWVRKKDCDLKIGYGNTKKNQTGDTWYAINSELGETSSLGNGKRTSRKQPQRMILRNSVTENLSDINKISEQYFKKMNDENPDLDYENDTEKLSGDEDE